LPTGQPIEIDVAPNEVGAADRPLEQPLGRSPHVFVKYAPPKPTEVFDTYWKFAFERQAIFFRRAMGEPWPWTIDPILAEYKFTNVYRASDRVSQFLIRHVIYDRVRGPDELVFRILLFKIFNRVDTWKRLEGRCGDVSHVSYRFPDYNDELTRAITAGAPIYSAAYIMPAAPTPDAGPSRKHTTHLKLIERMLADRLPERLVEAKSMQESFMLLRSYPSIGNFLAYQLVTDLNYSTLTNFSEFEFVIPGPGARDGLRKCFATFGDLSEPDVIRWTADRQEQEFERLGMTFQTLWGRRLQLIDCQNLFCEVDKYSRVKHPTIQGFSGRTRIKQRFSPSRESVDPWYPPKWNLNTGSWPGKC